MIVTTAGDAEAELLQSPFSSEITVNFNSVGDNENSEESPASSPPPPHEATNNDDMTNTIAGSAKDLIR
jgi:hypothetical protein